MAPHTSPAALKERDSRWQLQWPRGPAIWGLAAGTYITHLYLAARGHSVGLVPIRMNIGHRRPLGGPLSLSAVCRP